MPKVKSISSSGSSIEIRKPISPENAEAQCIALAMDLARKRLIEGTASSQEVTHFLKLGSSKAKLELEMMELEKQLTKAKTEKIEAEKRDAEMFEKAIKAMRNYSGDGDPDEY